MWRCPAPLSDDGTSVTRVWTDRVLDSHHGGAVLVDGYLYGSNFGAITMGTGFAWTGPRAR